MTDKPDYLKPVGGFIEVVSSLIPDLSLAPEKDLSVSPAWQATVYIQFQDNDRLVEGLNKTIEGKLNGRLPTSYVNKGVDDKHYLLVHFLVEDDSESSEDLVDSFADGIHDAISETSIIYDSRTDIEFVGEEKEDLDLIQ